MDKKQEQQIERAVSDNKLNKFNFTKKTVYSALSLLICVILIFVMSLTQAVFDASLLRTLSYWVSLSILVALCIFGMTAGQQVGDDYFKNLPNGLFRTALKKFVKAFQRVNDSVLFAYFEDWLIFYRERKLKRKIEQLLKDNGIKQMEVLNLDVKEVEKLTDYYKKSWVGTDYEGKYKNDETYFLVYTEEQIEIIKYCLTGKVKVSNLPRSFFVDAFNQSEKDMWESSAKSGKKKSMYLSANYIYKILALIAISVATSGLVPGSKDLGNGQVWISLAQRLFCLSTAYVWGIYVGYELTKMDSSYLEFKTDILNLYYEEFNLKIFVPENIEEKAKKGYEEANVEYGEPRESSEPSEQQEE